jgi:hypothetical protein
MWFPPGHLAEVVAALVVPICAAVLRAMIGEEQIHRLSQGAEPVSRQLALGLAIVLLLLFEMWVAMLTFTGDEPMSAWLWPACFYLGYIAAIAVAFRPLSGACHGIVADKKTKAPQGR